jgi:hypothetical protein
MNSFPLLVRSGAQARRYSGSEVGGGVRAQQGRQDLPSYRQSAPVPDLAPAPAAVQTVPTRHGWPRQWLDADHHGERLMLARTWLRDPGAQAA